MGKVNMQSYIRILNSLKRLTITYQGAGGGKKNQFYDACLLGIKNK